MHEPYARGTAAKDAVRRRLEMRDAMAALRARSSHAAWARYRSGMMTDAMASLNVCKCNAVHVYVTVSPLVSAD